MSSSTGTCSPSEPVATTAASGIVQRDCERVEQRERVEQQVDTGRSLLP
jgi:hypothetical protein